jgi:hypothetical protein
VIVVGFKPNPFFEPDWVKKAREGHKRSMERAKELMEQEDELRRRLIQIPLAPPQ